MGAAFPDASVEVREALAEGEWVACRMVTRGTQRGDWMGVPATGLHAAWEVIATYRLTDGRIVEQHAQADNISLMRQLGALAAGVGV
jgi:predicted ester cyclase